MREPSNNSRKFGGQYTLRQRDPAPRADREITHLSSLSLSNLSAEATAFNPGQSLASAPVMAKWRETLASMPVREGKFSRTASITGVETTSQPLTMVSDCTPSRVSLGVDEGGVVVAKATQRVPPY